MHTLAMNSQPPAPQSLGALMFRVSMRDQAAFKQLYDATARCLLGIIVRMVHDRSWAEEILQEVYVSVWHAAPNYSAVKSQPMTWLMAITRNRAMDALRSRSSERKHVVRPTTAPDAEDDASPDPADGCSGPLEQLVQSIEAQRLRHCLQRLDAPQRQAIALAFYDGLTHAELALHMRQPLGTVKAWVRRGLDRLRQCLDERAPCRAPRVALALRVETGRKSS